MVDAVLFQYGTDQYTQTSNIFHVSFTFWETLPLNYDNNINSTTLRPQCVHFCSLSGFENVESLNEGQVVIFNKIRTMKMHIT